MSILRIIVVAIFVFDTFAQTQMGPDLAPQLRAKIDGIAQQVLAEPGAPPSVSLAIVKDGKMAYVRAYGNARVEPRTTARPEMRYSIGSISKQFTATAIL
jgi:D-alanyl-D-alanine carboxypeptidase